MEHRNIDILKNFQLENIPDLDVAVLGALELFSRISLPQLEQTYKHPLIVGSGNAETTGKIIYRDSDAVSTSESNFEEKLKTIEGIDGVVLISASGSKHAPAIAKTSKQYGKPITLLTNTPNSPASLELDSTIDKEYVFPKNREPYTYNTSTYMGMIISKTKENPKEILDFIERKIDINKFSELSDYEKFFLIVPPEFSLIVRMLEVKFIELFGRNIARDVETSEYMSHAVTVVPSEEMFISFGYDNESWGSPESRMYVPLPDNADYGAMMAIGYYVVAQIQKRQPPYFKENIADYVKRASVIFKQEIKAIVE